MKRRVWIGAGFLLLVLMGCGGGYTARQTCMDMGNGDICQTAYGITDTLIENAHEPLSLKQIILVSCFVDVNNVLDEYYEQDPFKAAPGRLVWGGIRAEF